MENKMPKNPYPGLRPFEFAENHLFFGREGQSEEVLRRLHSSHFVAVVGTSGSGKSSLVRAGLLPLLYGGFMTEAGSHWRIALFRPGNNPIRHLAEALVQPTQFTSSNTVKTQETPAEDELKLAVTETVLRRSAVGLRDFANGIEFAEDENLLVVVDQFEELFRFKKENRSQITTGKSETKEKAENEACAFVKLLLEAAADRTKRIYVIITMRSDFLGDCSQFRDLPETINNGQYLIPRLTTEQLKKAIESPAKVKGAKLEPALAGRLLNDIGDDQDQLPVLQHALMRTWDKWAEEGNRDSEIKFDHYIATGGMATALSEHADEAFFELGNKDTAEFTGKQKIAEKLFKCLTETDRENRETRRAAIIEKIRAIADADLAEVISVIEVFRQPGRTFLMPPIPEKLDETTLIDISHESLIRKWDRLKTWVEEESQAAQTYRRLAEDAFLYKQKKVGFWSEPELTDAVEWKVNFKPNETWAELYQKTWSNRYLATYAESIEYLENSRRYREQELAADEAQRNKEIEQERKLREQAEALAEGERQRQSDVWWRRILWVSVPLALLSLVFLFSAVYSTYKYTYSWASEEAKELKKKANWQEANAAEAANQQLQELTANTKADSNEERKKNMIAAKRASLGQAAIQGDVKSIQKFLSEAKNQEKIKFKVRVKDYGISSGGPTFGLEMSPNADSLPENASLIVYYLRDLTDLKNPLIPAGIITGFTGTFDGMECSNDVAAIIEYSDQKDRRSVATFDMCNEWLNSFTVYVYIPQENEPARSVAASIRKQLAVSGFAGKLIVSEKDDAFFERVGIPNAKEIRYEPTYESRPAEMLKNLLEKQSAFGAFALKKVNSPTRGSMSIFIPAGDGM